MNGQNRELPDDRLPKNGVRASPQLAGSNSPLRPSTPIQNEDDDSFALDVSPSSSFELPYHILKNMTPVKNRRLSDSDTDSSPGSPTKDSSHQMRKQQQLNYRSFKLRQKQLKITERINELKQKQQLLVAANSQKLTESLNNAHKRRESFINDVKIKAKLSIERQEKMSNLMFKCSDLKSALESDDDMDIDSIDNLDGYDVARVKVIQNAFRKRLLMNRVAAFRKCRPFEKLLNYSYRKVLLHLKEKSEFSLLINALLTSLNLPDLSSSQSYKCFQLSFIIISDMKDSVRFNHHSGVNSNVSNNPLDNLLSNALPLLTFKISQILISTFNKFLTSSSMDSILNPFSIERLELAKVWRYYHFVFDCFKANHLENCLVINESAIKVVSRQLDIVSDVTSTSSETDMDEDIESIRNQRKFLLSSKVNLDNIQQLAPQHEVIKDWTNIGMSPNEFIQSIKDVTGLITMLPTIPQVKADMSALNESTNNRTINQNVKIFEFAINSKRDNINFFIPPGISVYDWRKYWMDKLMRDKMGPEPITQSELYGIPSKMSTGRVNPSMFDDQFEDNEDYEKLGILKIYDKYENLHRIEDFRELLLQLDNNANNLFLSIYDFIKSNDEYYLLLFEDDESCLQEIKNDFESIKSVMNYYEEAENYSNVLNYFRLHLSNLKTILSLGGFERFKIISRIEELMNELSQPYDTADVNYYKRQLIDNISKIYWDLEIIIFIKWVNFCKLPSLHYIKLFENIYKFISSKDHRIEMGVNSPHLRFPNFYKFIENNYSTDFSFNYLTMVRASLEVPSFSKHSPSLLISRKAFAFFKKVFINYIFSEGQQSLRLNEIIELFESNFKSIDSSLTKILLSSTIINILVNFDSSRNNRANYHQIGDLVYTKFNEWSLENLVTTILNLVYDHYGTTEKNWLRVYLLRQIESFHGHNPIKKILSKKFCQIFETENNTSTYLNNRRLIITSNFQFISKHVIDLTNEINCLIELIYEVYNPLLNWIYRDIGEPLLH